MQWSAPFLAGLGCRLHAMEPGEERCIVMIVYPVIPPIYIALCGNYRNYQNGQIASSLLSQIIHSWSKQLISTHDFKLSCLFSLPEPASFDDSLILSLPYPPPPLTYHQHHTSLQTWPNGASQAVEANAAHTLGRGHRVACQWQCDPQTEWICAQTKLQVV